MCGKFDMYLRDIFPTYCIKQPQQVIKYIGTNKLQATQVFYEHSYIHAYMHLRLRV